MGIFLCIWHWLLTWIWPHKGYACAIGCIDGRCFEPVIWHMRQKYWVEWIDFRTKAGVSKVLAENIDTEAVNNIMDDVIVSKRNHNSVVLVIVAHSKCAGNPVGKEEQIRHLLAAKKRVEFFELDIPTALLFVDVDNQTCEEIDGQMIGEMTSVKTVV